MARPTAPSAPPTTSTTCMTSAELCELGRRAGLDVVGVASAAPFPEVRAELERRKAAGLHAGMGFTYRNPARSTDPASALPGARSLVVGALRYDPPPPVAPAGAGSRPVARVAAYADPDRYGPLRDALAAVAEELRAGGHRAVVVADQNAMVDRAAAHRAGIGWWGKSANLLVRGAGSWFVLGSVVTDADLEPTADGPVPDGCGPCTRCLSGCPTGAIVAPGVVDARRCLAWLVQQEGSFPVDLRVELGDRIYGCDDCQEVCPPSRTAVRRHREASPRPGIDVLTLLGATDAELLASHGAWYIPRRDPDHLRRNALIVLGNIGDPADPEVAATVDRYRAHGSSLLREHAEWAARRLGVRTSTGGDDGGPLDR